MSTEDKKFIEEIKNTKLSTKHYSAFGLWMISLVLLFGGPILIYFLMISSNSTLSLIGKFGWFGLIVFMIIAVIRGIIRIIKGEDSPELGPP